MKLCNRCIWLGKIKKVHFYICTHPDSGFRGALFSHGKTRKACSLYDPRHPSPILQTVPEDMRLIEDLRGKKEFENSEFWIIGSDSNLDCYPDDFFDDKFSIAINLSCTAFPKSTFFCMSGGRELKWMISKYPDCLKKTILPLHHLRAKLSPKAERKFQAKFQPHREAIGPWENWGLEPIYMRPEDIPMTEAVPDYESTVKRILSDDPCDFVLVRTVAHIAVFAAAVLGAKKIILVACSQKVLKGRTYAHRGDMGHLLDETQVNMGNGVIEIGRYEELNKAIFYGSQAGGIARLRRDTIQLARAFEKYGIEIVRHRFDEDLDEFVFEEI